MKLKNIYTVIVVLLVSALGCSKEETTDLVNEEEFVINSIMPLKAGVNDEIEIKGSGFDKTITVVFNDFEGNYTDVEAQLNVVPVNNSTIKVIVPQGARTGKIKLLKNENEIVSKELFSVSNTWRKISDFPGKIRYNATAFTHDKYGYVGLGFNFFRATAKREYYKDFWKYNSKEDVWIPMPDFPGEERANATSVKVKEKVFVGFGASPNSKFSYNDMYAFDVLSESWTQTANIPYAGTTTNTITNPATYVKDNDIYFIGGNLKIAIINLASHRVRKYNTLNDTWEIYDMGIEDGLYQVGSHTVNNERVFIGGAKIAAPLLTAHKLTGIDGNGKVSLSSFGDPLPMFDGSQLVSDPISFSYSGKLFYGLGKSNNKLQNKIAKLENGNWSFIADFPGVKRTGASVFTINDKAYVGGGFIGGQSNGIDAVRDFYEYTIED